MTLLLTWFTGQWTLGSADKPTNSDGPGATRPSGTRSPHDSRAKSFREKVPTVPQAQSLLRPDRLILDRQVGQTLAGNAFSGSSPRHCHVWVPTASPRPQGLPRSKGRSSANKSTIKTKQNKGNPKPPGAQRFASPRPGGQGHRAHRRRWRPGVWGAASPASTGK